MSVRSITVKLVVVAMMIALWYAPAQPVSAANNFSDTFNGGTGSWKLNYGSWSIEGGELSQGNTSGGGNYATLNGKRFGDATYEFDLKVIDTGGDNTAWAGIQFKKMQAGDGPFDSGFTVYFRANGVAELYKVNKVLATASTGLSFTSFRHIKIAVSGSNIKVYVNNESTPRINHNDDTFASGYMGFVAFSSHWHFDNLAIASSELPYSFNLGPAELLYADSQMPTHMDQSFATIKKDANTLYYYMVNSYDPDLIRYYGPPDKPLQTLDFIKADNSYIDKNGHDAGYGMYEIWMPNFYKIGPNELIAFTHNEKYPGNEGRGLPEFSMGIAYSDDNGATWEFCGEILRPKHPRLNVGGSPYVIVGDYFYLYYNEGTEGTFSVPYPRKVAVARGKVQDVISAARNHQTSAWNKYNNGTWTQSALTGLGTPIIDNTYITEDAHADATYNSAIGKYLLTVQTHEESKLTLYSSSDGIHYSMEALVDVAPKGSVMQPYSSFIDLDGAADDGSTVDDAFQIMYERKAWTDYLYDDLYRKQVTITNREADDYSASSDFSSTQGSDQWYYQQWNGVSYSNMTWDAGNKRWKGAQSYVLVSGAWQHPDANDSVRTWKAPKAGKIRVSGSAKKASDSGIGDGVRVKIMKNGTQVWPASGWQSIAYNNFTGVSHLLTLDVAQDDEIHFVVNRNGTNAGDTTFWDPTIQYDVNTASSSFSSTQGAHQWHYKQLSGSIYSDMTWDAANGRWKGAQTYALIGNGWQHPDANDSVRAWQAPKAGKVRIAGKPKKQAGSGGGDGVRVKIVQNSSQLWPSSGWKTIANNNFTGISHDVTTSVAAGDWIYFIVNKNGTNIEDTTEWNPTISYTGYN